MAKKILIIEDDAAISTALKERFKLEGFDVTGASDGQKGLDEAKMTVPDLILLDLILPGVDGLAVLEQLRAYPQTKETPVIVLTNVSNEKVEEEAKKYAVSMFLVKTDWKIEDVVSKAKSVVNA